MNNFKRSNPLLPFLRRPVRCNIINIFPIGGYCRWPNVYNERLKALLCRLAILCCMFSVLAGNRSYAQTVTTSIRTLAIGDTIPAALWRMPLDVVYHPDGFNTRTLGDYRGAKLIIIDLWATWCGACVAAFPKMNRLQEEFAGDVSFLNISTEHRPIVDEFVSRRIGSSPQLTFIADGGAFTEYFTYRYLPHYIWIDAQGVIRSASEPAEVNRTNIENALEGDFSFRPKVDIIADYDMSKPLLHNLISRDSASISYSSTLLPYQAGFQGLLNIKTDSVKGRKVTFLNLTRQWLFTTAYSTGGHYFSADNTILEVASPEKINTTLVGQEYLDWLASGNGFCYEQIVRFQDRDSCWVFMQRDLARMLPEYRAEVVTKRTLTYVLRVDDASKFRHVVVNASAEPLRYKSDEEGFHGTNIPVELLLERINRSTKYDREIIHELDANARVTLSLPLDIKDLSAANCAVQPYGLVISVEERDKYFLTISDRGLL